MKGSSKKRFKKRRQEETVPNEMKWLKEVEGRLWDERNKIKALLAAGNSSLLNDELNRYWEERAIVGGVKISKLGYIYRGALLHRLHKIDEALRQLKMKTYGYCLNCGKKISSKRLMSDPANLLCPPCQTTLNGETLPPSLRRYLNAA
jgi:RNA polymerase-binding transcription factor DksA